jgi:hypothetical protein
VQHTNIPVVTQYATAELIEAIAYHGHDPAHDPAWARTGATSQQEYTRWCRHACGMACLHMALHHRDGHAPPILDLLRASLPYHTYTTDNHGSISGMFYAPFAAYTQTEHHLPTTVHPHLTTDDITTHLNTGQLVIASVHKEIRRPHQPPPARGGHLVLITGHDPTTDTLTFHNPSGHTPATRQATLPTTTFTRFYAHRGITVTPNAAS